MNTSGKRINLVKIKTNLQSFLEKLYFHSFE